MTSNVRFKFQPQVIIRICHLNNFLYLKKKKKKKKKWRPTVSAFLAVFVSFLIVANKKKKIMSWFEHALVLLFYGCKEITRVIQKFYNILVGWFGLLGFMAYQPL